jgi:hypothetical protein
MRHVVDSAARDVGMTMISLIIEVQSLAQDHYSGKLALRSLLK